MTVAAAAPTTATTTLARSLARRSLAHLLPLQAVVLGRRRTLCSLNGSKQSCLIAADALRLLDGSTPFV